MIEKILTTLAKTLKIQLKFIQPTFLGKFCNLDLCADGLKNVLKKYEYTVFYK